MLKGKAIIELENVKTGEKETHVEENMITNAISNLFTNNVAGMQFNLLGSSPWQQSSYNTPLCPNALGGILLFADSIEEDADTLIAPADNYVTGYASNNSHSTENAKRGNYNVIESGAIDGGYRLVWEFLTSQGNGTISSIGLTHAYGGRSHLGCLYNDNSLILASSYSSSFNSSDASLAAKKQCFYRYANVVEVNFAQNYFISIYFDPDNHVVRLFKVRKCFTKMNLTCDFYGYTEKVLEDITLSPTTFCMGSNPQYFAFHDGKDGYWWGFQHYANSSGNAVIQWMKISKTDYSFTEGVWTFDGLQINSVGYFAWTSSSYNATDVISVIRNGYLYVFKYGRAGVYKININNIADISYIDFGFTASGTNTPMQMYLVGGYIKGPQFTIDGADRVERTNDSEPISQRIGRFFQNGVYLYGIGSYYNSSNYYFYQYLYLITPYLASINNLSESVVKTADKTMKITYVLTEVDENTSENETAVT